MNPVLLLDWTFFHISNSLSNLAFPLISEVSQSLSKEWSAHAALEIRAPVSILLWCLPEPPQHYATLFTWQTLSGVSAVERGAMADRQVIILAHIIVFHVLHKKDSWYRVLPLWLYILNSQFKELFPNHLPQETVKWANKVAQRGKVLATKPDNLS